MNSVRVHASSLSRIRMLMWVLGLMLACLLVKPALAQSTYGQVVGILTDPSKAVIPGASVTLTEVRTNIIRTTQSKEDGAYEFVNVPLGQYRINVEKSGFQKYSTQPFPLEARQTMRIDAELVTGGVSTEVLVVDAAPLVNTENPTIAAATSNLTLMMGLALLRLRSWMARAMLLHMGIFTTTENHAKTGMPRFPSIGSGSLSD